MPIISKQRTFCVILILLSVMAMAVIGHLARRLGEAREAARQSNCRGRFCQLVLALNNYHDVYGSLPPAFVADNQGKPMHSWRVLLLPFLDHQEIYQKYRFDEPWNSPHNSQLGKTRPNNIFGCPSGLDPDHSLFTDYVVIVGPETAFPGDRCTSFSQFQDGLENTILVAEISNSGIHWMEPRDLESDRMSFHTNDSKQPSISSPHPLGPAIGFGNSCGGYRLSRSIQPTTIKAMITIAGHEHFERDRLISHLHPFVLEE